VRTFFCGKEDGTMPGSRYDAGTRARAIRLVREHAGDYPTQRTDRGQLMDDHLRPRLAHRLGDLIGVQRVGDHRHGAHFVEHRLL
jgi:hypothetical protein